MAGRLAGLLFCSHCQHCSVAAIDPVVGHGGQASIGVAIEFIKSWYPCWKASLSGSIGKNPSKLVAAGAKAVGKDGAGTVSCRLIYDFPLISTIDSGLIFVTTGLSVNVVAVTRFIIFVSFGATR